MLKSEKEIIKDYAVRMFEMMDEIGTEEQMNYLKKFPYKGNRYDITTVKGMKKYLKAMYKKEIASYYSQSRLPKELYNTFTIHHEYDYLETVYFFHKTENIMEVIEELIPLEGTSINSPYDCTGQWFEREATVIELEDRVIVYQTSLLDV